MSAREKVVGRKILQITLKKIKQKASSILLQVNVPRVGDPGRSWKAEHWSDEGSTVIFHIQNGVVRTRVGLLSHLLESLQQHQKEGLSPNVSNQKANYRQHQSQVQTHPLFLLLYRSGQ